MSGPVRQNRLRSHQLVSNITCSQVMSYQMKYRLHKILMCVCLGMVAKGIVSGHCLERENVEPQNVMGTEVSRGNLIVRPVLIVGGEMM